MFTARTYYLFPCIIMLTTLAAYTAPVFHIKNKGTYPIAIVIQAQDSATQKRTVLQHIDTTLFGKLRKAEPEIRGGFHKPAQPILLKSGYDLAYYDLHGINALEIYFNEIGADKQKKLVVYQYKFGNVTDNTTFYLKYCDPQAQGPLFCKQRLAPQAGETDKTTDATQTTEGYSLEHNITQKSIRIKPKGIAGNGGYPIIDFDSATQNYEKLPKK